jgi:hypothetical protein
MVLTNIEIFRYLPGSARPKHPKADCGECGLPTCMAFAVELATRVVEPSLCPYLTNEAKEVLGEAYPGPNRRDEYLREYVAFYLDRLRRGEDVFFNLIDHRPFIVPYLVEAYYNEPDRDVRFGLVEAINEHRLPESVGFLGEVLETDLWKLALDGLVTIGSPSAIGILKRARQRFQQGGRKQRAKVECIDEAIQQIEEFGTDETKR